MILIPCYYLTYHFQIKMIFMVIFYEYRAIALRFNFKEQQRKWHSCHSKKLTGRVITIWCQIQFNFFCILDQMVLSFYFFTISGQMFLMDRFFDGAFLTFGLEVIAFAERDQVTIIAPLRQTICAHTFLNFQLQNDAGQWYFS